MASITTVVLGIWLRRGEERKSRTFRRFLDKTIQFQET
jgi:hypothetical protein